jgi:hypothetical protein
MRTGDLLRQLSNDAISPNIPVAEFTLMQSAIDQILDQIKKNYRVTFNFLTETIRPSVTINIKPSDLVSNLVRKMCESTTGLHYWDAYAICHLILYTYIELQRQHGYEFIIEFFKELLKQALRKRSE